MRVVTMNILGPEQRVEHMIFSPLPRANVNDRWESNLSFFFFFHFLMLLNMICDKGTCKQYTFYTDLTSLNPINDKDKMYFLYRCIFLAQITQSIKGAITLQILYIQKLQFT